MTPMPSLWHARCCFEKKMNRGVLTAILTSLLAKTETAGFRPFKGLIGARYGRPFYA